jgi:tetratricopeptide (TPR) repeat protein/transcriptional regulator with XRE-family HTH domain
MGADDASDIKKKSMHAALRLKRERELRGWTQSELAERIGTTQVNVSRWEKGVTVPGPYYRQRLGELFSKSLQELGFVSGSDEEPDDASSSPDADSHTSTSFPTIWNVPYRRNPFFTGREEVLSHLHDVLTGGKTAVLTQALAISGLGGIGKTQIAVEYAYRYRHHYQAIFWVTASTHDTLSADFVMLAASLNLSEQHEQKQDIVVGSVKRWLTTHGNWLLIVDNVDDPEMVIDFLPVHAMGNILLTTRLQALGTVAHCIEVEKMGLDEGVMFLLRRTRELASDASLDQATEESRTQAAEIVDALDGLPLALDQAGAYIEETRCGLAQYLALYGTRRKELLLRRGRLPVDHPEPVAATWSLSFQQVEQESSAAADLLHLLAFLDPEAIPEEIITLGAVELGPVLGVAARDPLKIDEILGLLLRYSLIRRTPEARSLSIHRLIQAVLKDGMDQATQRLWAERTIRAVNRAFPTGVDLQSGYEPQSWEKCQRCLPHALMCMTYSKDYALLFPEAAHLFNKTGSYLTASGNYEQAERLLLGTLELRHQILETDYPDIARTLNDLGELYLRQSRYKEAEKRLQETLSIRQRVLGIEHLDVARTLNDLADLHRAQGDYRKAEPFYIKALNIREAILGTDHPLVAYSYYSLAKLYYSQEKYQQGEGLCQQAIDVQERHLGSHPRLATTLHMLAKIYQGQRKLDQAEQMNMRALQIREKALGANHPHVAVVINSLVEIYHAEGKYSEEIESLIARSLKILEQSLGPEHPYMAYSFSNLAKNFFLQGDFIQAEIYYKKALAIREKNLGLNHPRTASAYYNLANVYATLERYEEAALFYGKAFTIRELAFDSNRPTVINTLKQYIDSLRKLKREDEAYRLEEKYPEIEA